MSSENKKHSDSFTKDRNKEYWASRVGVIFAVMGSAIGLGNFLRFPGLAASYAGGAFMIPYFIAFLLLGLPMAYMEWSLGRQGSLNGYNSGPGIFRSLWKNSAASYLGVFSLLVPLGIYMYYLIIEGYTLYYAISYLTSALDLGHSTEAYGKFFSDFVGIEHDGFFDANGTISTALIFLVVTFTINFFLIYRGLNKGIELAAKYGIPLLFLIAVIILIRVLTLGTPDPAFPERNVSNALGFMWNPSFKDGKFWASLQDAQMWLDAAAQIFFTLSVGLGIITTYSSYVKKKDDMFLSATTSSAGNEFAEVALGGMIVVPAAFLFLGTNIPTDSSFQLGFITMPLIFSHIPFGAIFGFLWFFLLFIAAITSSLSLIQPVIAFLEEGLGMSRKTSSTILGFLSFLGSAFIAYFSAGLKALDTMDFWVGTFMVFVLAGTELILGAWIFGADKLLAQAQKGSLIRLPKIINFLLKYVSPIYLLVVFVAWANQKVPGYAKTLKTDTVAQMTIYFILAIIVFFLVLIHIAVGRWKKMEAKK